MLVRQAIRSNFCGIGVPKRVFDLVIDGELRYLEMKVGKTITRIPWEDVIYQVEETLRRI